MVERIELGVCRQAIQKIPRNAQPSNKFRFSLFSFVSGDSPRLASCFAHSYEHQNKREREMNSFKSERRNMRRRAKGNKQALSAVFVWICSCACVRHKRLILPAFESVQERTAWLKREREYWKDEQKGTGKHSVLKSFGFARKLVLGTSNNVACDRERERESSQQGINTLCTVYLCCTRATRINNHKRGSHKCTM